MNRPTARRVAPLAVLLSATALLAGCAGAAGAGGASSRPDSTIVVRDGALRAPGTECAGSGQYLFIHTGERVTVTDSSGAVVLDAPLPAGRATRADDNDYGSAKRVPTFCTFEVAAAGLTAGTVYSFAIKDRSLGTATFRPEGSEGFRLEYPALGDPAAVQGEDR